MLASWSTSRELVFSQLLTLLSTLLWTNDLQTAKWSKHLAFGFLTALTTKVSFAPCKDPCKFPDRDTTCFPPLGQHYQGSFLKDESAALTVQWISVWLNRIGICEPDTSLSGRVCPWTTVSVPVHPMKTSNLSAGLWPVGKPTNYHLLGGLAINIQNSRSHLSDFNNETPRYAKENNGGSKFYLLVLFVPSYLEFSKHRAICPWESMHLSHWRSQNDLCRNPWGVPNKKMRSLEGRMQLWDQ